MGLSTHHKISATISILILICTFGLRAIRAQDTADLDQAEEIATGLVEEIKPADLETDLEHAETTDGQKTEIVKQIRKLNADGSYTVGYEADDGTFKIESRDVLGNVKGTYGYVDINGEIKRVSYITNNGTAAKSDSTVEGTTSAPRRYVHKGTPTTRRPPYSSSTISPTRSSVIQQIPKRLRISSASSAERIGTDTSMKSSTKSSDPTTTVIYATSVPTPKPYINIRPTPLPGTNMRQPEQLARPDKLEINEGSKIQVTSPKELSTTKPVTEEVDEKEEVTLPYHNNLLRRQLMPDAETQYDTQHQIVYNSQADDDVRNVYGTIGSTARPLFTTTSSPRVPPAVLAARQRAAQIQNAIKNTPTTTEKYYIKSSRRHEASELEPTTESTSENTYLTQNPIPVQIPATRDEGKRILRRPIQRPHFIRLVQQSGQQTQQQEVPVSTGGYESPRIVHIPAEPSAQRIESHDQYLRETTVPPKTEQIAEQEPIPARIPQPIYRNHPPNPSPQPSQYYVYPEQDAPAPYSTAIPYPPPQRQFYDFLDRPPVTTRDFERLLQILIYRHQQIQQRQSYGGYGPNPYFDYNSNPYDQYPVFASRPQPTPYPYRVPSPYADPEGMYQAQNPVSTIEPPMSYELQRLMPRKKQYNPRYFGAQQPVYAPEGAYSATAPTGAGGSNGYLPSEVREELLYRMLMLALQSESQHHAMVARSPIVTASDSETSTTKTALYYKKPVRSVQIIGEEN